MTQRLTPEREAEIRLAVKRQQLFGGHSEDLLAEIEALRAELSVAAPRRISCVHSTGMCSGPTLHFNWLLDAESRAAVDSYHQAMIAHLAGAEERGRQQAVELLNGYMLSKLRSRGEPLYLSEICELRDQLVRTGTAAADAGEPTPSEGQASTASAGCPEASPPATRPDARQR